MSRPLSWSAKIRAVHERAQYCCEYCQTCQKITGQAMHVDHIDPQAGDDLANLCLACASCNLSKSSIVSAVDEQTQELTALFNPRRQVWAEHFRWIDRGLRLEGLTPTGRVTIIKLKINQERLVNARSLWIKANLHPPADL